MNKQHQESGDNSKNYQAQELTVYEGLSYTDVKAVALDVFKANFHELSAKANEIAASRAEEITEKFLIKLQAENPQGILKSEEPSFQRALFNVQQEHATNGDNDLGDLLVDLLVDRSKQENRNILQIVLNESLVTAPKLTKDQLAALAIIFLFRYTIRNGIGKHQMLGEYFDKHVAPFCDKLNSSDSCFQHLEYTGCGAVGLGEVSLLEIIKTHYQGMFLKGINSDEITQSNLSFGLDPRFFIPCLNDSTKIQVKATNKEMLDNLLDQYSVATQDRELMRSFFNNNVMSDPDIRKKCIEIRPYMTEIFSTWSSSSMKSFTLTSVGIAIGHANIKRFVGEFSNLSIWIK